MNIEDKLKKARIKMFRKDIGLMLFGACAYKFDWRVHEMSPNVEGYIVFDNENLYESLDGIIHINEYYATKDDYTHDNLIALIIHETLHILQKHGSRKGTRDPKLWNLATDHVVDRDLKSLGLEPYQNRFNIISDLNIAQPNCTAEQAYEWIYQNFPRFTITDNGDGSFTITDDRTGQEFTVNPNPDDNSGMSDVEKEKMKTKIDQFVSEARALNQTLNEKDKARGTGPSKIQQYLDELLKVEIDWSTLLEKAIKTNTILKPNERSWRKLNPYFRPHNITLPGMGMVEEKENVGTLILLIDTSGSISNDELKKFAYVLNKSLSYFNKVKLLTHDSKIHQEETFEQDDFTKFYDFIKNIGFKGRGGTSHQDCFEHIENEIWKDRDERDLLSMVISLTDGYSDIEHLYKNYNWIKNNTPLIFVCTSNWEFNDPAYEKIDTIKIK